jgi:hypothetical protein
MKNLAQKKIQYDPDKLTELTPFKKREGGSEGGSVAYNLFPSFFSLTLTCD